MKTLFVSLLFLTGFLVSCQVQPYAPPPQKVTVESVEVKVTEFHGRPEVYAIVKGFLTTSAAQLVDTKQSRDGRTIYLEVREQTPRGANLLSGLTASPPFEKQVPLELIGLPPGSYRLVANEIQTVFTIPTPVASRPSHNAVGYPVAGEVGSPESVEDGEWIDLEDTEFIEPER
ncbi:MAG: hypothetical protein P1U85_05970 [Verrucomicrobiales bacterium]|nr:hypothetical protein [Verrucomicrobiales bacterium]